MRELELDGIHDDAEHVVLRDSDGQQYTLRIDEALRAAVRRDRPALGLIQATERAPLRPREIQAMLRSGRSAEEIAQIAGVGVEHVRRYEGPVLAERAFIAERARAFHVGRGGGPVFGQIVQERLRARRAGENLRWDAWRMPDGTWTVELAFEAGGRERVAHWIVDMTRQSVLAEDDEARWLTDDDGAPLEEPARSRPRLSAVRGRVYDVEADGGVERAWRPVGGGEDSPAERSEHPAAIDDAELEALNARRGLRPVPPRAGTATPADPGTPEDDDAPRTYETGDLGSVWSTFEDPGAPDEDAMDEYAQEGLERLARDDEQGGTEGEDAPQDLPADEDESPAGSGAPTPAPVEDVDVSQLTPLPGFDGEQGEPKPEKSPKPRRNPRGRRTSMPSWDEIVFGSKND